MKLEDLFKSPIIPRILLILYKSPGIHVRKLIEERGGSSTSTGQIIKYLVELGLVKIEKEKDIPRRHHLYLTEKGNKIAELLERIDEILGE
ncbi:hypothetical protein DRO69_00215 [Candidatus Bathyarchaeota archaeon]|nr:MAG: hypothetical protein DRO69_00215 [Candidatus Bathyarchaeota archaeon]